MNAKNASDKIHSLTEELNQCKIQLEEAKKQEEYLSSVLHVITSSTSWKVTAPIRHTLDFFKKKH